MPSSDGWKNLKPVQKGEKGRNPAGRPKGRKNASTVLRELLECKIADVDENGNKIQISSMEKMLKTLIIKGHEGDIKAIREILERIEGKAVAKHEITGADGEALTVNTSVDVTSLDARIAERIVKDEEEKPKVKAKAKSKAKAKAKSKAKAKK